MGSCQTPSTGKWCWRRNPWRKKKLDRIKKVLVGLYEGRPDVFVSGAFYICNDLTDGNRRFQPDCIISLMLMQKPSATICPTTGFGKRESCLTS